MRTFAALTCASMLLGGAVAREITVSPDDDFEAVCLLEVEPGDTCYLEKGDHKHDGLTRVHGTKDKPIVITGHSQACIKGSNTQDRALQIAHDYYTVENICFDGKHGSDYVATAIYVLGADRKSDKDDGVKSSVVGFKMLNLEIKNFNSECVHFRYFVTHAEIQGCVIQHCGKEAFDGGGGGKVGEAVYIGTALDQVDDDKAPEVKLRSGSADNVNADVCQYNWIHHNTFRTYGNECVDVKEGSTNNLIEYNVCEQQKDENSGGIGFRGSENTARYNEIAECVGAGIRVGGDQHFGKGNNLYGNTISNVKGAFNVMDPNQGYICGNKISDVDEGVTFGAYKDDFTAEEAQADCTGSEPGDIDGFSSPSPSPSPEVDPTPAPYEAANNDETGDEGDGAGVNFADGNEDSPALYDIDTNSAAGSSGMGECATVLSVAKMHIQHDDNVDSSTDAENLFDSDLDTYFSVNRESTKFIFELSDATVVNGVSIGFFMKAEEEERIQVFDIAILNDPEDDWETVISRKESSGEMGVMQTFPFTGRTAQYVRFESHGNDFNNWTPLTEIEICGEAKSESNALFGGMRAASKELQTLTGEVCASVEKLAAVTMTAVGDDNVSALLDGNLHTRWTTDNTNNVDDLNNDAITMRFLGDMRVSHVKMAFFDGHLAHQHFALYKQAAGDATWTLIDNFIAEKTESYQTFDLQISGVNKLYIVGHGNDVGLMTKISEVEVYGC